MKLAIRVILLTVLMAVALTMAVFTLADFGGHVAGEPDVPETLVLGSFDGSVAVFGGEDLKNPLEVTDIPLDALRSADRALVEQGVSLRSREELAAMLEDLGS